MNTLSNNSISKSYRVNQVIIVIIALINSILFNLHRAKSIFDNVLSERSNNVNVSLLDIVFRFIYLFVVSWFIIQLNTNWYYKLKYKNKIVEILTALAVHILLFFVVTKLFIWIAPYISEKELSNSELSFIYLGYIIIFLTLVFIAQLLSFQIIHKNDLIEKEMLKKHSFQNELMALKNQINPHFLFNSLNSLSALVKDNKDATFFINKLSYLYRYILQSGEKDVVSLDEELIFLKSYIHLLKVRYKDRVSVIIDIEEGLLHKTIPVLSLQLLVENAVKHNEISKENPLIIKLFNQENVLIILNEIKPRTTINPSTGKGLDNIKKRFLLLKDNPISINTINNKFKVKLPL